MQGFGGLDLCPGSAGEDESEVSFGFGSLGFDLGASWGSRHLLPMSKLLGFGVSGLLFRSSDVFSDFTRCSKGFQAGFEGDCQKNLLGS